MNPMLPHHLPGPCILLFKCVYLRAGQYEYAKTHTNQVGLVK